MVQQPKLRKFSELENIEAFDLGIHNIFRSKPSKRKERVPISMRCKVPSPLDFRTHEMKVKGWETNIDDFVDFLWSQSQLNINRMSDIKPQEETHANSVDRLKGFDFNRLGASEKELLESLGGFTLQKSFLSLLKKQYGDTNIK